MRKRTYRICGVCLILLLGTGVWCVAYVLGVLVAQGSLPSWTPCIMAVVGPALGAVLGCLLGAGEHRHINNE